MTAQVASMGLFPMALYTSISGEVLRQLLTVVIGGICPSTLLALIGLPAFYLVGHWR